MALESITLNVNVKGDKPVFHCSQYDNGRPIIIDLVTDDDAYIPAVGVTFELHCRKNDDHVVTLEPDTVTDNRVTFISTEQLTACVGDNLCEVSIMNDGYVIGTLNFILKVEPDPLANGLTSESDIYNLTDQIEDIATEVIGENYYNKTETDALLADKADVSDLPDMTNYYTKTQTDTLLNGKADTSDLATLASKAELTQAISDEDTALKNWAYTQFATTPYVNNLLFNMLPVGKASGNPCTFDTEIEAVLQELTAEIIASGGNGTPSNPIPIVGHSELNLDVNGDTFTVAFGQTVYGGVYDKSGRLTITHTLLTFNGSENWSTRQSGVGTLYELNITEDIKAEVESISNMYAWEINLTANNTFRILASGSVKVIAIHDDNRTDLATFKSFLSNNNLTIRAELATPIVIDVQAISVFAEKGTNNITSDCIGDVTASYKDSIQHYIDNH